METIKLPEKVRLRLNTLYQSQQQALAKLPEFHALNSATIVALEWFGLDTSNPNHHLDLATGIITPASSAPTEEPTPIHANGKSEEAVPSAAG